jgi:hypothetical protein
MWYLDPPTPLVPLVPIAHLVLPLVQPIGTTHVCYVESIPAQLIATKSGEGNVTRGKSNKTRALPTLDKLRLPQLLQVDIF